MLVLPFSLMQVYSTAHTTLLEEFDIFCSTNAFIDFSAIKPLEITMELKDDLNFSISQLGFADNVSFIRNFVLSPILFKTWRLNPKLSLFSRPLLATETMQCYPDFLFGTSHPRGYRTLAKPLFVVLQSNKDEFTDCWFKVLHQMIVSQQINKDKTIPIFAVVSNGKYWEFGKLDNNLFTKNLTSLSISDPEKVLSILSYLAGEAEKYA